jgi:hypothetical protein
MVVDVPHQQDAEPAIRYGEEAPDEYGGVYFEGVTLIVLFTNNLETHRAELERRVNAPSLLDVRCADRTFVEAEREKDLIVQRLMKNPSTKLDFVTGVGITLRDRQWVTSVGVESSIETSIRAVRDAVAPTEVVIEETGRLIFW